ncbi:hypothetical protein Taro_040818 [Colocasia esculenta]|uniref:Uncharacterized protein n=1 Tax=Colocasia esculenta TaxID=4460 RepID=A0A843W9X8_COLES|nr:hypothetical protein [Colocasia esculenta]
MRECTDGHDIIRLCPTRFAPNLLHWRVCISLDMSWTLSCTVLSTWHMWLH